MWRIRSWADPVAHPLLDPLDVFSRQANPSTVVVMTASQKFSIAPPGVTFPAGTELTANVQNIFYGYLEDA